MPKRQFENSIPGLTSAWFYSWIMEIKSLLHNTRGPIKSILMKVEADRSHNNYKVGKLLLDKENKNKNTSFDKDDDDFIEQYSFILIEKGESSSPLLQMSNEKAKRKQK